MLAGRYTRPYNLNTLFLILRNSVLKVPHQHRKHQDVLDIRTLCCKSPVLFTLSNILTLHKPKVLV